MFFLNGIFTIAQPLSNVGVTHYSQFTIESHKNSNFTLYNYALYNYIGKLLKEYGNLITGFVLGAYLDNNNDKLIKTLITKLFLVKLNLCLMRANIHVCHCWVIELFLK